ncbi:hypothetical protein H5410_031493 [Solanum commersonii]|uniref:Uncharacterized protein n=1 Tax=Solanum commersonii TaxID=4109 RepID=A0A9J5YHC0_SOLCO|nr:hypothetical protein H5410_031493 [Solanum commersonii]
MHPALVSRRDGFACKNEESAQHRKVVIQNKYGKNRPWCTNTVTSTSGNGNKILFWEDIWKGQMALKNSYPNLFSFCTNPGDDNWSNHEWDISFRRYLNDWKWIDWLNSYKKSTASKALLQSPTQSYGNKLMMVKTLRTDYKKRREQPGCGIEPWKQI